jgi:two-component sensor histidine kinase
MALIHELLYQTRNLSNIKANQYLNQLVSFISDTYTFNKNIKVNLHIDPKIKRIDMNKSIPCGLIINELLSNAFKYAFPNKTSGKINIDFKVLNKKPYNFSLCISDNGIGLPSHIQHQKKSDTLGLQLVESLTEQLDGKLIIEDQKGTKITVLFN